jgi:hypothetical protein
MSAPNGGAGAGAGGAFDAHAPAEGFRLRGAAKLAFVTEARGVERRSTQRT